MRVLDIGSGPGTYVEALRRAGMDAEGWDPYGPLDPPNGLYRWNLLTDEVIADQADCTLCLEVGEHLHPEDASDFIEALAGLAPTCYFSAAKPGQGGEGHVNCQEKSYWQALFARHGMAEDVQLTHAWLDFMRQGPHMGWLLQNGMVMRRIEGLYHDRIASEEQGQAERIAEWLSR